MRCDKPGHPQLAGHKAARLIRLEAFARFPVARDRLSMRGAVALLAKEFGDFLVVLGLVLADRLEVRPARARYRRRNHHPGPPQEVRVLSPPQDAGHKARRPNG